MKNPHIIVDPATNRCLCGIHGIVHPDEQALSCGDILAAMDRLVRTGGFDGLLVKQTIMSVVKDRPTVAEATGLIGSTLKLAEELHRQGHTKLDAAHGGPGYIRINKVTDPGAWYARHVGEVLFFERVEINRSPSQGIPEDVYWCREGGTFNAINYVRKSDASEV